MKGNKIGDEKQHRNRKRDMRKRNDSENRYKKNRQQIEEGSKKQETIAK